MLMHVLFEFLRKPVTKLTILTFFPPRFLFAGLGWDMVCSKLVRFASWRCIESRA